MPDQVNLFSVNADLNRQETMILKVWDAIIVQEAHVSVL
jgi:hypothetical protein